MSRFRPATPAILLAASAALAAVPARARAQDPSLPVQMENWYGRAQRSAPGKWAVVVADQNGNVIWQVNGSEPMTPASTVKLLTTGFARTVVGPDGRRATRVVGDGRVDPTNGTWLGRWALEVNGDPTLERPDRTGPMLLDLAHQLASIGVRRLVGPLTVTSASGDATPVFPSVWSKRFRGHLYAPLIGPLTLNENVINFAVVPGSKIGAPAQITDDAPTGVADLISVTAKTTVGTRSALRFAALGGGKYRISGSIGIKSAPRRYATVASDPMAVLDAAWRKATRDAGITWIESPALVASDGPRRVLAEVASEPFDSIAHEINTRSLNIGAELLLRWGGGPDAPADRLTRHVAEVTGIRDGAHLVDGSGLSSQDWVTPLTFISYLAKFPQTPAGRNFPLLLPANGNGTLKRLATGLPEEGVVRAKTGTLSNVATLVGYLGRTDGTLLIAAMYNGGNVYDAKQAEWTLFRTLGAKGVVIPADDDALGGQPAPDKR